MRFCAFLLLLSCNGFLWAQPQEQKPDSLILNVFLSAHPDDWQLFMNPNAYKAVEAGGPVLFIHSTAGDAGTGMGYDDYTLAREAGSLNAIRFMVNMAKGPRGKGFHPKAQTTTINGKSLRTFPYENTTAYFLRLPDGNGSGKGYELHEFKSLEKFYKGEVRNLHTVDSSASYKNKKELQKLITALVNKHADKRAIRFHIADTDSLINPGDHSDHRHTSHIVQEIAKKMEDTECYLYREYSTNQHPMNVSGPDFLISAGTWGATTLGLTDFRHYSTWDQAHNSWIGRQYYRKLEED